MLREFLGLFWFCSVQHTAALFTHPGVLLDRSLLDRLRHNVQNKIEPQYSAYLAITSPHSGRVGPSHIWLANGSYAPKPQPCVPVNSSLSPGTRWLTNKQDSLAAYTHALLWYITEDEAHVNKSIEIMDAWAAMFNQTCDLADSLEAGWTGTIWARAAEIVRHTSRGVWSEESADGFATMLQNIWLPMVNEGASTNGNIALVMSEAAYHIAIFADNQTAADAAVALWRKQAY